MKNNIVIGILAFSLLIGLIWVLEGNNFFLYKVFAPKYESVRRETFEQSRAYNQGMVQELQNMQFEYVQATPQKQDALASIILHRVADYDENKLPSNLQTFVWQLRNKRVNP